MVYVLHAFQKKSKRGSATPQADLHLIKQRLQQAQERYQDWLAIRVKVGKMEVKEGITSSSGSVFADLGLSSPEERDLKAQLASQIQHFIEQKG